MEEKNRKNPFWNAKLTSEERLDWLLANMTLEEKITCMASTMPELPRFGIDMSYVRSEERRVGKECLRLCRSRWSPYH